MSLMRLRSIAEHLNSPIRPSRRDFRASSPNFVIADQGATPALMKSRSALRNYFGRKCAKRCRFLRISPSGSPDFRIPGSRRPQSMREGANQTGQRGSAFLLGKFGSYLRMAPLSGTRPPPRELLLGGARFPIFLGPFWAAGLGLWVVFFR